MTKLQKIQNIIMGLLTFVFGLLFVLFPREASGYVLTVLMISTVIVAIKTLTYYFTMARFMVNGRTLLFKGLLLLDFAFFSATLLDVPQIYILLYLAIIHAFSGLVEILRAMEGKRYGAKRWRLKFSHGLINIFIALYCILFFRKVATAAIVYGLGLIYSSVIRIITAFRQNTMAYYQ